MELKKNISKVLEEQEKYLKDRHKILKQQRKAIENFENDCATFGKENDLEFLNKLKKRIARRDKA